MTFAERLKQQADKAHRTGQATMPYGAKPVLKGKSKPFEYDNYVNVTRK